jgi:hypothetical protein
MLGDAPFDREREVRRKRLEVTRDNMKKRLQYAIDRKRMSTVRVFVRKLQKIEARIEDLGVPSLPPPCSENLRLRKAAEARLATDEQALAKAERENSRLAMAAAERRMKRAKGRIAWLEANPTSTP